MDNLLDFYYHESTPYLLTVNVFSFYLWNWVEDLIFRQQKSLFLRKLDYLVFEL